MKITAFLVFTTVIIACIYTAPALSFPQYQAFIEKHSGRSVNCAMCHVNDDGPIGNGIGQIGGLKSEELEQLNKARTALEPGLQVDNPILNKFGNEIIHEIGMKKFIELKADPVKLSTSLNPKSDLDNDGISDAQEYLDGTDPLNKYHGDSVKLFLINLNRYKVHIVLVIIAIFLLDYGLVHLLNALSITARKSK